MKINNTQTFGMEASIRGMRNPKNSHHLSDSYRDENSFILGEKDLKLAQTLIIAGTEHCKFMRQVQVWADMTMPRYFFQEFDTYKIGISMNSSSTVHKLFDKNTVIKLDMFVYDDYTKHIILNTISELNLLRDKYFETTIQSEKDNILRQAKIILPESYLNTRTINLNYATLRNIMLQRKNHKLKEEWQDTFCKWITTLPYAKELIFLGQESVYDRLCDRSK